MLSSSSQAANQGSWISHAAPASTARSCSSGGAASVTGVDISPNMIEVARAKAEQSGQGADGRLQYQVGDVLDLGIIDGGEYDMVTGVWLLNYASSREELAQMYRGIRANLKPSGHSFGVGEEPQEDLDAFVRQRRPVFEGNRRLFGLETEYTERLASGDGYVMETRAHVDPAFTMKTYHLRKSIIIEAARAAGLKGHCEIRRMKVPEEVYAKDKDYWALYDSFTPKFSTIFIAVEPTESMRPF
ncbi:S-adenosyl-L-methionine-dependent methyltransferase [Apiospora aurea]|uniref:S-adenosyl-L-methionine-dependent methyltransferase n=1 Tax=Apiospora aurea TaxID=335848 RepID=A0ABR1QKI8_9PEZI